MGTSFFKAVGHFCCLLLTIILTTGCISDANDADAMNMAMGGHDGNGPRGGQGANDLKPSCNAAIAEICGQNEQRSNTPCAVDEAGCREASVMACGREIRAFCRMPANCLDVEYACPDDLELCDPDSDDTSCRAYEMGDGACAETVYCGPAGLSTQCNAPPSCEQGEMISHDECQDDEDNCRAVTKCGSTMYCRAEMLVNCAAEPVCEPGQIQSGEPCDEGDNTCSEVTLCGTTIFCRQDAQCDGLPACNPNEASSQRACDENEENCRRVEVCGSILFCRSEPDTIPVNACNEPASESDDMMLGEIQIVDDVLYVSVSYSGGCADHRFDACFGAFSEGVPVGTTLTITHESNGDSCERAVVQDLAFDLTPIKTAYQAGYGVENGTVQIRVPGSRQVIEYDF